MKKIFSLAILLLLTVTQANASFILPNAPSCEATCLGHFSVGGDWLYWRGEQTELNYGARVALIAPTVDTIDVTSEVLRPNFKYQNGWRINADYVTPENNWRFSGSFTHMPFTGINNLDTLGMSGFDFGTLFNTDFPLFNVISSATFSTLNANWSADLNYIDLTASHTFNVYHRLEVTPYIGLRGIWLCETFRLNGIGSNNDVPVTFDSTLRGKIGAGGLQAGLKSALDLTNGFSIVGMFGGSLMYGSASDNGILIVVVDDGGDNTLRYSNKPSKTVPSIDTFIGFEYISCLMNIGFDIHVGWENHIFYETNEFSFVGAGSSTTAQGLTLGANVHF